MKQNIPLFKVRMTGGAAEAVKATVESGWIGQGPRVEEFERGLVDYIQYPHLVTLNSATSALQLGLRLAGVRPYDQVLSSPLTCFATNTPILASHATIKWADVDPQTCNIDIDDVVKKVSDDTAAILFVHWGGVPVDVEQLVSRVTDKLGKCPPIIEDCAHSMGSYYKGGTHHVGTNGNFGAFSFQAIKHLTTADGGMLTMAPEFHRRAKLMRWYGIDRDNPNKKDFRSELPVEEWGYKFHMNDVAAVMGIENLKTLDEAVDRHRDNAAYYDQELRGLDGLGFFDIPEGSRPAYWLYTMKVERREDFMRHLRDHGIVASRTHERNDIHPCVERFQVELPKLDSFNTKVCCIPVGWWVSDEDREYIVEVIKQGW